MDAIAYGVPLVVVGAGWLIRHELARRTGAAEQLPVAAETATAEAATAKVPTIEAPRVRAVLVGPDLAGEPAPDPVRAVDPDREVRV